MVREVLTKVFLELSQFVRSGVFAAVLSRRDLVALWRVSSSPTWTVMALRTSSLIPFAFLHFTLTHSAFSDHLASAEILGDIGGWE